MTTRRTLILGAALAAFVAGGAGCAALAPTFKTDLTDTLTAAKPQLSDCYSKALAKNPKLSGQATLRLTVEAASTALSNVALTAPQGADPAFEQCVARVAGSLQVKNAPVITVNAEYPLTFTPNP